MERGKKRKKAGERRIKMKMKKNEMKNQRMGFFFSSFFFHLRYCDTTNGKNRNFPLLIMWPLNYLQCVHRSPRVR